MMEARDLTVGDVELFEDEDHGPVGRTWLCGPPPRQGQRQRYPSRFFSEMLKDYPGALRGYRLVNGSTNEVAPELPVLQRAQILHMFSGSIGWGKTTDFRPETGADTVAPYDDLPFADRTFDVVFADPPYNAGFSNEWTTHRKELPKPKSILREGLRVLKPGGRLFLLHVITVPAYKDFRIDASCRTVHPVLCGPGNAIRQMNVFRKPRVVA